MTTSRALSQERVPNAELVAILETDVAEVAGFIAAQSGRSKETIDAHLRWFLLENPARRPQDPMGFGLRSGVQLVGCILCSPQAFRVENQRIVLMGSSSFYVDARHRGHGGRIFLQYSRLANQRPLFGTSANAEAAALWKAAGASPIPGSEAELFGVLRWPPVAEEVVHRRGASRLLSRVVGSPVSQLAALARRLKVDCNASEALRTLTSAEQITGLPLNDSSAKLTAMRDLPYIRWRYFSGRDASVAVFAFRSRAPDREILVTVNQRTRGYRNQINTLNILDVYPEVPPEEWLRIVGALIVRYKKNVDAVVLRNQDQERQKVFCEKGFQRRIFDAPTGWFLDKAGLMPTREWYSVPADGDGLI
jgi:hypothetical protein